MLSRTKWARADLWDAIQGACSRYPTRTRSSGPVLIIDTCLVTWLQPLAPRPLPPPLLPNSPPLPCLAASLPAPSRSLSPSRYTHLLVGSIRLSRLRLIRGASLPSGTTTWFGEVRIQMAPSFNSACNARWFLLPPCADSCNIELHLVIWLSLVVYIEAVRGRGLLFGGQNSSYGHVRHGDAESWCMMHWSQLHMFEIATQLVSYSLVESVNFNLLSAASRRVSRGASLYWSEKSGVSHSIPTCSRWITRLHLVEASEAGFILCFVCTWVEWLLLSCELSGVTYGERLANYFPFPSQDLNQNFH